MTPTWTAETGKESKLSGAGQNRHAVGDHRLTPITATRSPKTPAALPCFGSTRWTRSWQARSRRSGVRPSLTAADRPDLAEWRICQDARSVHAIPTPAEGVGVGKLHRRAETERMPRPRRRGGFHGSASRWTLSYMGGMAMEGRTRHWAHSKYRQSASATIECRNSVYIVCEEGGCEGVAAQDTCVATPEGRVRLTWGFASWIQ